MPAALIQVHYEFIYEWGKRHNYTITDVSSNQKLIARIQKEIDFYNKNFGKWEQIKKFEINADEWTIEAGHLTPTMKMRRKTILEKYSNLVDKIYK